MNNNNAAIMHFIIRSIQRQRTITNSNNTYIDLTTKEDDDANNSAIMHIIIRSISRQKTMMNTRKIMMLIMMPLCTLL